MGLGCSQGALCLALSPPVLLLAATILGVTVKSWVPGQEMVVDDSPRGHPLHAP